MNGVLISYLDFSPIIVTLGGFAARAALPRAITHDTTQFGFGSSSAARQRRSRSESPCPLSSSSPVPRRSVRLVRDASRPAHDRSRRRRAAARSLGVGVRRIPLVLYVFSGLAAAAGGLIITSELDGASLSIGVGLELEVLTAILLGGVAFSGGRGSLWGVLFGVLFVGVLDNGLILLNVGPVLRESGSRCRSDRGGGRRRLLPTPGADACPGGREPR